MWYYCIQQHANIQWKDYLVGNSRFIRNHCTRQSFHNSEVQGLGCGITALNSNLAFNGSTFFIENTQTTSSSSYCGGAIWASGSTLHFNGTSNFIGNTANGNTSVGGAIYANTNSSLWFIGTNDFRHNSAEKYGGAIDAYKDVVLIFNGTNHFINNSANIGGAIYVRHNTSLSFTGTSNFVRI